MQKIKLYGAIVFAMIFWSVSFIWTRVAIHSFHPVTLIALRLLIASILLYIVSFMSGKFQAVRREDRKWFIMLAFFEPFMYYMGETYGLTMVDSTLASVIVSTIPLFAPVLAYLLLREKIGWTNILGILVSLCGVFLVIYEPQKGLTTNPLGITLLFLAVLSAILYVTTLRKISTHYFTINVVFYQSAIGLLFFIPTFLITDLRTIRYIHVSFEAWSALLMLAVFASVLAFVLFAGVVRQIGVARTNVFINLIPVFTALFAWIFMGEKVSAIRWLGIFIVVIGLFISQLSNFKLKLKLIRGTEY